MTWVAMGLVVIASTIMLAIGWNNMIGVSASPVLVILLWGLILAPSIFLFMLAVKKAHRLWVDEEQASREEEASKTDRGKIKKDAAKDSQELDFAATARKLVRRAPEGASLEDVGKTLIQNLARELEIMSGIFYIPAKGIFKVSHSYAISGPSEPFQFKMGEGLTGQVARNQQLMVLTRLPEEFLEVYSGLGKGIPSYLAIVPLIHQNKTIAVLECSGYKYDPHDIENLFRILARDLMDKISPNLS